MVATIHAVTSRSQYFSRHSLPLATSPPPYTFIPNFSKKLFQLHLLWHGYDSPFSVKIELTQFASVILPCCVHSGCIQILWSYTRTEIFIPINNQLDAQFLLYVLTLILYISVSQTVVRGPQVVLGFCPCGPFRLNISPKKTQKIKLM